MYFNSTLTDSSKLLKPLLVFSFVICAIICGLTRIIQYKNHAMDVYLGFLLGGAIAVYLVGAIAVCLGGASGVQCGAGLYAVGNFRPSEEGGAGPPPAPPRPPCSLPHISQEAVLHHLQMKAGMAGEAGLHASRSEGLLHRGLQRRSDDSLQRCGAAEAISPRSPQSKDPYVTFSHTLPRVHTPQAMAAYEEAARRHAATLHHASMDSSRSKQLLSQWKSKNSSSKRSPTVPDAFSASVDSSSSSSAQHPQHHGSMELRPGADPSGGFDGHAYMSKMATGASSTLPSNCSGITGGARMALQPRPGSSQLVHIPEEAHENYGASSPRAGGGGGADGAAAANAAAQANWQRAAEMSAACRADDGGPRLLQVIAMSKQHGLLQTHSRSLDEGGGGGAPGSCQGAARYRVLTDPDAAGPGSLGSTGSIPGSSGAIVRVEAHPEHRPVIQAPSTDGSWRWRSLDHANGGPAPCGAGGGGGASRQSFDHNDPSRDSESSDSIRDGSIERNRGNHVAAAVSPPPVVTVHTQSAGHTEHRLHPQGVSTIRVTPGDGGSVGSRGGGGGESASDTPSVASSRESTLRRKKGNHAILIPERADSPDNARHVFYKGTSISPAFKE
ncbi:Phospholipid phosphatase-related protein type 4 [Liparis tanakae]|uniref:Phospholipid phosphatase-related protein type 4 n=1 Tax=Liparis tanakae TaxID=230148 RepID=A0A4Z2F610_9TELE|nr:Phospholipid phosphatase-related protein type 4 [Liparis tanakae]